MEPLVDFPCLTQPPTKSYCIATIQRHLKVPKRGKGGGGRSVSHECLHIGQVSCKEYVIHHCGRLLGADHGGQGYCTYGLFRTQPHPEGGAACAAVVEAACVSVLGALSAAPGHPSRRCSFASEACMLLAVIDTYGAQEASPFLPTPMGRVVYRA